MDESKEHSRAAGILLHPCAVYFTHPPGKLACKGLETLE
jgi:hypothetical protein